MTDDVIQFRNDKDPGVEALCRQLYAKDAGAIKLEVRNLREISLMGKNLLEIKNKLKTIDNLQIEQIKNELLVVHEEQGSATVDRVIQNLKKDQVILSCSYKQFKQVKLFLDKKLSQVIADQKEAIIKAANDDIFRKISALESQFNALKSASCQFSRLLKKEKLSVSGFQDAVLEVAGPKQTDLKIIKKSDLLIEIQQVLKQNFDRLKKKIFEQKMKPPETVLKEFLVEILMEIVSERNLFEISNMSRAKLSRVDLSKLHELMKNNAQHFLKEFNS